MSNRTDRSDDSEATVGALLRGGRTTAKLTQDAVAAAVGVRQSTVSAWENGTAFPTLGKLDLLADLLQIDLTVLVRRMISEAREGVPA